jgi:hypothetical protein
LRRKAMMRTALLTLVLVVGVNGVSWSQEGVLLKEKSVVVVANDNLKLRSSPPSGLFYMTGDSIGTVEKGQTMLATDEKTVKTLFGEHKWLKVDLQDAKGVTVATEGWVYVGEVGGKSYVNMKKAGGVQ